MVCHEYNMRISEEMWESYIKRQAAIKAAYGEANGKVDNTGRNLRLDQIANLILSCTKNYGFK